MDKPQSFDIEHVNWEDVILKLTACAHYWVKHAKWFRKPNEDFVFRGKQVSDYVMGAIEYFLRNPEKFDPNKRSLVGYLNNHILRRLISNDAASEENKSGKDVFSIKDGMRQELHSEHLETAMLAHEDFTIENIDADNILKDIEQQIQGDEIAENIFLGVVCNQMKRREVCSEFQMTEKDYDNGIRRLNTAIQKTLVKFNIQNSQVR